MGKKKIVKNHLWTVIRVTRECFEVLAPTEEEALEKVSDPYSVTVVQESCTKNKGKIPKCYR